MSDPGDDMLTGKEAASVAGVNTTTIWRAAERGGLTYTEVGGSEDPDGRGGNRRYKRSDVEKWARGRRKQILSRMDDAERRLDVVEDVRLPAVERRLDEHERDHP